YRNVMLQEWLEGTDSPQGSQGQVVVSACKRWASSQRIGSVLVVSRNTANPKEATDRVDFDELFRAEFGRVARSTLLLVGDHDLAQDLAQEAFVRALVRWESFASREHAAGFVHVVALNEARSYLRA